MNAIANFRGAMSRAYRLPPAGSAASLDGLRNYAAKEVAEWLRTRRAFWTAVAAQALLLLGVLGMRIYAAVDPSATGIDLSANYNMFNAGWETVPPLCAVLAAVGLLIGERENRTLAWSLSMPLGRDAVLVAKLATILLAVGVLTIVLPLATTLPAIRLAYGEFPDAYSTMAPLLTGVALSVFLVILSVAASTFVRSQWAATAITLIVAIVAPGLIAQAWPAAVPWWPMSIEFWIKGLAGGESVNWISPVSYGVASVGLLALARIRLSREEF